MSFATFSTDLGDMFGFGSQRRQQEFNSAEAQSQRDWEEYMSNTSYQRAMEDIEAAGLNPSMLYASGGAGASTPSGSSASSGIQSTPNILGQAGQLINAISNAKSLDMLTSTKMYKNVAKIITKLL